MKYINERTGLLILMIILLIKAWFDFEANKLVYTVGDLFVVYVLYGILKEKIKEAFFKFPVTEEEVNDDL